jgi:hypothetical protein
VDVAAALLLLVLGGCESPGQVYGPKEGAPSAGGSEQSPPTARVSPGAVLPVTLTVGSKRPLPIVADGHPLETAVQLTAEKLEVQIGSDVRMGLVNPFGEAAEGKVQAFPVGDSHHLLVTMTDGRVVMAYVLIPQENLATISLVQQVDFGATVEGDVVKLSWRQYKDDGGYIVVSDRYRFNPANGAYEKVSL